jgi:abortive infection bacteriophage resistance protein
MSMRYCKPWKSALEQIMLLETRGLYIGDHEKAAACLERIGYYRLSGYWYAFRERSGPCCALPLTEKKTPKPKVENIVLDGFRAGASFQNALDLYVFDKQLRLLTMDALERIEIALRVDISHTLGKFDTFAYLKPELFHSEFTHVLDPQNGVSRHHDWLGKHAQLINRSKEEFVRHNKSKYGLPLAIWIACEVWDFGTMSKLFHGMREEDQDGIAGKYGIKNGRIFASWLRSLNYLRNVCAHHCRLWNRNIVDQPRLPSAGEVGWVVRFEGNAHARARCYLLLVMISQLIGVINPNSSWQRRMGDHLRTFPDLSNLGLNLLGMGAIEGWDAFDCTQKIKNP